MGMIDNVIAKCKTVQLYAAYYRLIKISCKVNFSFDDHYQVHLIFPDVATVVGYLAVSRPFLDLSDPRHMHSSHNEIMLVSGQK